MNARVIRLFLELVYTIFWAGMLVYIWTADRGPAAHIILTSMCVMCWGLMIWATEVVE